MGDFCAATGFTPTEFWELTNEEVVWITKGVRKKNG
jgi:hypothetical protein